MTTTVEFGDADPEDTYDEVDPPRTRLLVLARTVDSIQTEAARTHDHRRALVRLIWGLAVALRLRNELKHGGDRKTLEQLQARLVLLLVQEGA